MNTSLIIAIVWVLVISAIGMLPRRFHPYLGLPMLALLPFILGYIAYDAGPYWALGLLIGAISIFRYPLRYFGRLLWQRLRGNK
ncbi:MAG: DUF2484 family protein [Rhodobacteraceae bacterium]|nr:DUF2484 family protein [Paracoccaceae bacterium]